MKTMKRYLEDYVFHHFWNLHGTPLLFLLVTATFPFTYRDEIFLLSGSASSSLFWWIRLQERILSYRNIKLPRDDRALAAKCSWYNNSLHVLITSSDLIATVVITVTVLWVHHSAAGISQLRRLLSSEDFRTARMSRFFHFRTFCTLCCLIEVRQKHVIKNWVNCLEFKEKEKRNTFEAAFQRCRSETWNQWYHAAVLGTPAAPVVAASFDLSLAEGPDAPRFQIWWKW